MLLPSTFRLKFLTAGVLLSLEAAAARAAPASRDGAFLEARKDVIAVAVERARRAPDDAQRALKAGQDVLRRLHAEYQVAKSTPPTVLDADVREMTAAATRVRLARSKGQTPAADPRAEKRIASLWEEYRARADALSQDVRARRGGDAAGSALYWEALKRQDALAAALLQDLAYNAPPGERSAEEAVAKDRWELLKGLEDPARAAGRSGCVKAPEEGARDPRFDIAPFYRAAGLLPGANPLRKGSFEVPPGCRTVTQREDKAKLIVRADGGRGVIVIGRTEKPLAYDYVIVPPEVPYLIENAGEKALDVEYIALEP